MSLPQPLGLAPTLSSAFFDGSELEPKREVKEEAIT
jgi:hypothetical protein